MDHLDNMIMMISQVSRWLQLSLVVACLSWAGGAALRAHSASASDGARLVSQLAPPSPAQVPGNASHVSATVRTYSVWPPGSLHNTAPSVPPDHTLYSLVIEIHTAAPERAGLDSRAQPGMVIEAFSPEVLASDLPGKRIEATVELTGDTRGVRWRITNIRVLP